MTYTYTIKRNGLRAAVIMAKIAWGIALFDGSAEVYHSIDYASPRCSRHEQLARSLHVRRLAIDWVSHGISPVAVGSTYSGLPLRGVGKHLTAAMERERMEVTK